MKNILLILTLLISIFLIANTSLIKTANGTDIIYDYSTNRLISSITILFEGGTLNYNKDKAGIEDFLLQMIQKGSKKYPMDSLNKLIDKYGIKISYRADMDYSYITFSSINKHFPLVLDIVEDLLKNPIFDNDQIEVIRNRMLASIKQKKENPDDYIWDKLNEDFFKNHPYEASTDGNEESVNNITYTDLKHHLEKLLFKNNVIISIVTGVPLKDIKKSLLNKFSELYCGKKTTDFILPPLKTDNKTKTINISMDNLMTSYIAAKYLLPSITDSLYPQIKIGLSVLSRKVYETLRTKYGLTYAAWVGASQRKSNYGYFYVSTDYPDSALTLIYKEFDNVKKTGITQKDLDNLLNQYETSFYMQNEKTMTKSFNNAFNYMIYGDWDYNKTLLSKMRQTNTGDLINLFNKYLKNFTIVILSNKNEK